MKKIDQNGEINDCMEKIAAFIYDLSLITLERKR
jgi:hypothetical protein